MCKNEENTAASNFESQVLIIIVLYNPDIEKIIKMIGVLKAENFNMILIDNTPAIENSRLRNISLAYKKLKYLPLLENKGIAYAQNKGIAHAKQQPFISHTMFLDQDTSIELGFVAEMLKEYKRITFEGVQLGVLAPKLINERTGLSYKKNILHLGNNYVITDKVSSSGSLISLSTLALVGNMEEDLFIDLVDSEWCWRAKKYKLLSCITNNIKVKHPIGEQNKTILGFEIIISAPFRYYYQYRNWIKMMWRSYVPIDWKIKTTIKYIFFMFYYPLYIKKGFNYAGYMLRGIKDGFTKN